MKLLLARLILILGFIKREFEYKYVNELVMLIMEYCHDEVCIDITLFSDRHSCPKLYVGGIPTRFCVPIEPSIKEEYEGIIDSLKKIGFNITLLSVDIKTGEAMISIDGIKEKEIFADYSTRMHVDTEWNSTDIYIKL